MLACLLEVGVDPLLIPDHKLDPECLPPIEASDLLSYLVLDTSYYTNKQFKAFKSLQAYNQMVSGFICSIQGTVLQKKHVVVAKVRHSQRMNDPLVTLWIIANKDGSISSAHCIGCMAGLGECCSHIASVMFYIEFWTRVNGKLSCTQVKCTWILPTYVKEVNYSKIENINFTSAKKLKADLDKSVESLSVGSPMPRQSTPIPAKPKASTLIEKPSEDELSGFFASLSECKVKPVALSLVKPYSESFIIKSRNIPSVTDLFQEDYLMPSYPELLKECYSVDIVLSDEDIELIERDTIDQAKGGAFFLHRAGRIGASRSKAASHSDPAQPSQSLIKTICYPNLYRFTSQATDHGCKHEDDAIRAYEAVMTKHHKNFKVSKCGLLINKGLPFLHATCDFLCSCDCCGLGCGEVKCPFCIEGSDFENYVTKKASCLVKVNDTFSLKRDHAYYYQVQQQLFTTHRGYNDFIVCSFSEGAATFVHERIYPDKDHWEEQVPKLTTFWRACVLPEILGRWYTKKPTAIAKANVKDGICYCKESLKEEPTVFCSNENCPISEFHHSCILPKNISKIPKRWFCPHCRKLPEFKPQKKKNEELPADVLSLQSICVCNAVPDKNDKLLCCNSGHCKYGKYFHLSCLKYKKLPNNSKTTWICQWCKAEEV